LSSDWSDLNISSRPGVKLDLRYDYLSQNQLRSGRHRSSPQAASIVLNDGDPQEVGRYTRNRYFTAGLDVGLNADWGNNM